MLLLCKLFDWENALINVKPETLIGWHRKAFQNIQQLIAGMATNKSDLGARARGR
jgi:hypothetical protein